VEDLGLERADGRVDLRGIVSPPRELGPGRHPSSEYTTDAIATGVAWRDLDFSKARIGSIKIRHGIIDNCVFDGASCLHLGMWATRVTRSTFLKADLRAAVLGGVETGKRNEFCEVNFSGADLRESVYDAANFTRCTFSNTKLRKVNFWGSVFVDCTFEGVLDETTFARYGQSEPKSPTNEMRGVDFRRAELRSVEFYGLDLEDVKWPERGDHLVIHDFVKTLDKAIAEMNTNPEIRVRGLAAYLGGYRQHAGPNQKTGVVHLGDMAKLAGRDAVDEFLRIVRS
jgi:uncharacterized protein YjbI with pentapeptide repeats